MKNILIAIFLLGRAGSVFSQGDLRIANAYIHVTNNTAVTILGNMQYDNGASSQNNGEISLKENWINNSGSTALDATSKGKVVLGGGNQDITGSDVTYFYDLEFKSSGVKTTLVDVFVTNTLQLGDAVLQTDENLTRLTNPAINSLDWNLGYIESSKLEGYFLRSTNLAVPYSFPVGHTDLLGVYRAVELTPSSNDSSVFGVRLGANDPTFVSGVSRAGSIAPFDVANKELGLGNLNTTFYHNINRFYGTANANATVYFFENDEEEAKVTTMAKWNSSESQWVDDFFRTQNTLVKPEYNNANRIALSNNVLTYNEDVYTFNKLDIILTTVFTPNNDGMNDLFKIPGLEFYPKNKLEIYNRWGELVYSASPYLNDWDGINTSKGIKLQSNVVQEDTYFYVLTLDDKQAPIKNFLEIIRD